MSDDDVAVASGYAFGQLRRALDAATNHPDAATRRRARTRTTAWTRVVEGMADGTLTVGSRTPVKDTPAWVTLEVVHGGFATGRPLAEQPLRADERAVLAQAPPDPRLSDRERLNLWYLSDPGQRALGAALRDGTFGVDVPEDAALLVVAWLLRHERHADALDLVGTLRPLMHRLRFTPVLDAPPPGPGGTVHLQTVGEVADRLRAARVPGPVAAMRTTLGIWHPLFDRLVALWCDTVEGALPRLSDGGVTGGWPARTWPADWAARRERWLADHAAALRTYPASARRTLPKSDFARLRGALERCPAGSDGLTGRDVGWIRRALANTITRHGAPGSGPRTHLRAGQAEVAARPTHAAVARTVARRLDGHPPDAGLAAVEPVVADVGADAPPDVPAGTPVPPHLVAKVRKALEAPVADLVALGVITSGESLARVLPQLTAEILAADLDDPALRAVHRRTYTAFRRRRSLLLLNLESQVRFTELPWVAAMEATRTGRAATAGAARRALDGVSTLVLRAFPHAVLPNTLVRELTALAGRATPDGLPLVQEVAADIFTGRFTDTWHRAAEVASTLLGGTLYARYYDLPAPDAWAGPAAPRRAQPGRLRPPVPGRAAAAEFAEVCRSRAREAHAGGHGPAVGGVAANGAVLEQSQILTTHNLAVLVDALDRPAAVVGAGPELAERALRWVVAELRRPAPDRITRLRTLKNGAYAWRQAVFFLGFADRAAQEGVVDRLRAEVAAAPDLGPAFPLAVDGLAHVVRGGRFDADGRVPGDRPGRRYLGWSVGPHWLDRD